MPHLLTSADPEPRPQMWAEAQLHEAEADELPPRVRDVVEGADPWWRQIMRQLIGVGFNAAQFYFLQYLPNTRADRRGERNQPRAPLF